MQEIAAVGTHDAGSSIPAATPQPPTSVKAEIDLETAANEVSTRTPDHIGTMSPCDQGINHDKGGGPVHDENHTS
jgi:hypothetical protein